MIACFIVLSRPGWPDTYKVYASVSAEWRSSAEILLHVEEDGHCVPFGLHLTLNTVQSMKSWFTRIPACSGVKEGERLQ